VVASPNADCASPGTVPLESSPTDGRLSRMACPSRIRTTRIPNGDRPLRNPPVVCDPGHPEGCPRPRFVLPERAFRSVLAVVPVRTRRARTVMLGETLRFHTRWRPAGSTQSLRHTRKGALDRHPRIRWVRRAPSGATRGSRRSVGVAADERVAAAPLRPEDRAGLAALRSVDAVPTIRCDPKDHGGRGTCTRRSPGSGAVRPNGRSEPKTTSDSPRAGLTGRGPW
jgi:hypothetical protein